MTTQSEQLAAGFAEIHTAVVARIEGLDESRMQAVCAPEQCTVAALACHMVGVETINVEWIAKIAAGESLPDITMDDIHQNNAHNAATNGQLTKADVLARLNRSGEALSATLNGLSDADFSKSAYFTLFGGPAGIQQLVELAVIGHFKEHLASIEAAT